jgi:hypothetical protein
MTDTLAWKTTTLPNAPVGEAYVAGLPVTGSTLAVTWTKASGTLPPGLTLTGSGLNGVLAGTPTTAGTYTFVLTATSAAGGAQNSGTFKLVVGADFSSVDDFHNGNRDLLTQLQRTSLGGNL